MIKLYRLIAIFASMTFFAVSIAGAPEKISQIQSIDTLSTSMVFHCLTSANTPVKLYCSFPTFGGVRIHSDTNGFYVPQSVESIIYRISGAGEITAQTSKSNGPTISLRKNPLQIIVSNKYVLNDSDMVVSFDSISHVLKSSQLFQRLQPDEALYGFGERFDSFNARGGNFTLWQAEQAITPSGFDMPAYKEIPIYYSSAGYAMFLNSTYKLVVDAGKKDPNRLGLSLNGPIFDFYIWSNGPLQAIQSYTDLTGKPILPPKWVFEPWAGGGSLRWGSGTTAFNAIMGVVRRFRAEDIPHSAMYIEKNEGNGAICDSLNKYNYRPLAWHLIETSLSRQKSVFPTLPENQLPIVRYANGSLFYDTYNQPYVDFTNTNAVALIRSDMKSDLDRGLVGSMLDFGDQLPETALLANGRSGAQMHNFYSFDYNRIYAQVFSERRATNYVLFSRSGSPGTQSLVTQFSGDHPSTAAGLIRVIRGGLNAAVCGFSTWGCDIGGIGETPTTIVYDFWAGYGLFNPLMRLHGQKPREPWYYGPDTLRTIAMYKRYAWLRENLLDYIYSTAVYAHKTGVPIMRPLPFMYPQERSLVLDNEYMFGPDILVSAVLNNRVTENIKTMQRVTFPPGRWTHYWTKKVYGSASAISADSVPTPVDQFPFFIGDGALIRMRLNKQLQPGATMTPGSVTALLTTPPVIAQRTQQFYKSEDTVVTYTSIAGVNSYTVQADQVDKTPYILVYGATVTGVKVGTQNLYQLQALPTTTGTEGWLADPQDTGRYIVCLPVNGWNSVTIATQGVGVRGAGTHPLFDKPVVRFSNIPGKGVWIINSASEIKSCDIISASGAVISHSSAIQTGTTKIAPHALPAGIYLVRLNGKSGSSVVRFVVR